MIEIACNFRANIHISKYYFTKYKGKNLKYFGNQFMCEIIELIVGSAVLGSYFLNERLGILGKLGCAMSLLGSVIIVLHAPPDQEIDTVDEILNYAIKPGE